MGNFHSLKDMQHMNIQDTTVHPLAKYRNHLEFNGYHVEEDDDLLFCRHSRKANLILRSISDRGVLISTLYSCTANIQMVNLLTYVNALNADFLFIKAYINEEEERSLVIETFFEGNYDRTNFSILLDNFEYDMNILYQNELTEEYLQ